MPDIKCLHPTYQNLFKTDSYHTVEPANSVVSPGAYLIELLKLIDKYIKVGQEGINFDTRRPDIRKMLLFNKNNTFNELSKLRIVLEVLKNSQSETIELKEEIYPFNLPYNDDLHKIRLCLKQQKMSLPILWKDLSFMITGKNEEHKNRIKSIALETLNLSEEQWNIYSKGIPEDELYKYYGFKSEQKQSFIGNLSDVTLFFKRTQLTRAELTKLSQLDRAQNTGIENYNEPLKISDEKIIGLKEDNLSRITRFVRLAKAIDWSFIDLDMALRTFENQKLKNEDILLVLAWIQELRQTKNFSVETCCTILGNIKNYGKANKSGFYDSIFSFINNLNFKLPIELNLTGDKSNTEDQKIAQNALALALKITHNELLIIGSFIINKSSTNNGSNKIQLNDKNLALLYRLSKLGILCELSIPKTISIIPLTEIIVEKLLSDNPLDIITELNKLIEFTNWIKTAPFSLNQIEFILTGKSQDALLRNSIFKTDTLQNFKTELQQALKALSVTKENFNRQFKNSVYALLVSLCESKDISELFENIENTAEKKVSLINVLYDKIIVEKIVIEKITKANIDNLITNSIKEVFTIEEGKEESFKNKLLENENINIKDLSNRLLTFNDNLYDQQQNTLAALIARLYKVNHQLAHILISWADIEIVALLSESSVTKKECFLKSLLCNEVLHKLHQVVILIKLLHLSASELEYFKETYQTSDIKQPPISLATIKEMLNLKHLISVFKDRQNKFIKLIQKAKHNNQELELDKLVEITNWNKADITLINTHLQTQSNITRIYTLYLFFNYQKVLGISAQQLLNLVQKPAWNNADTKAIAKALWAGLQANTGKEKKDTEHIEAAVLEELRTHLIPLTIHKLGSKLDRYSKGVRGLYEYSLIDPIVSASIKTSYVKEAISACQLYIDRVLNQLEPYTTFSRGLTTLWQWSQHYTTWRANQEVFLYPEDYIQPELRKNKTTLFAATGVALKQVDLSNPDNAEKVFRNYMNGFLEIAGLKTVGCAARSYELNGVPVKELCMVGITRHQPYHHYWRIATFIDTKKNGQYKPVNWGEWKEINIKTLPVKYGEKPDEIGAMTPVFAFGKWHLFWVEQQQTEKTNSINQNQEANTTYAYKVSIYYSYLNFSKQWVAAHEMISQTIKQGEQDQKPIHSLESTQITLNYSPISKKLLVSGFTISILNKNGSVNRMLSFNGLIQTVKSLGLKNITGVKCYNNDLYITTSEELFYKKDGRQWKQEKQFTGKSIITIEHSYDCMYVATTEGLFYKQGNDWEQEEKFKGKNIIALNYYSYQDYSYQDYNNYKTCTYIATTEGLFLRQGNDREGEELFKDKNIITIEISHNCLYVATTEGLFYKNNGLQWEKEDNFNDKNIITIENHEDNLYIATTEGLYYKNYVDQYEQEEQFEDKNIVAIECYNYKYDDDDNYYLYIATTEGLFLKQNNNNWEQVNQLDTKNISGKTNIKEVFDTAPTVMTISDDLSIVRDNIDLAEYLTIGYEENNTKKFNAYRLNTNCQHVLSELLHSPTGISSLLSIETQKSKEPPFQKLKPKTAFISKENYPSDNIDSTTSAMGSYYWELFFHLPFLIAKSLQNKGQYKAARTWYEYIFNPRIHKKEDSQNNDRYWCFIELRASNNRALAQELSQTVLEELREDMHNVAQQLVESTDPFNPHALARLRPIAYQKTMVTHYIDNLMAWGDQLYRTNTRESINEAEMLYISAYNLLGDEPKNIGSKKVTSPITTFSNTLMGTNKGLYILRDKNYIPAKNSLLIDKNITCIYPLPDGVEMIGTTSGFFYKGSNGFVEISIGKDENTNPHRHLHITAIHYFYDIPKATYVGTTSGLLSGSNSKWTSEKIKNIENMFITCIESGKGPVGEETYFGTKAHGLWYKNYPKNITSITKVGINKNEINFDKAHITCIFISDKEVYAGTTNGLYKRGTGIWKIDNLTYNISCLYKDDGDLYAGTKGKGLYRLNKSKWEKVDEISDISTINGLYQTKESPLFVGTDRGLFQKKGDQWSTVSELQLANANIYLGNVQNNEITLSTSNGICKWDNSDEKFVFQVLPNNIKSEQFDIPQNIQFLQYWHTLQQRLYNIRNGLTIDGQINKLALFQPPQDPMKLVVAVGSGASVAEATHPQNTVIPHYRFEVMVQKAKEITTTVINLGQSLMSAFQSQDAEKLAVLYNKHYLQIITLTLENKKKRVLEAKNNISIWEQSYDNTQDRLDHYNNLINKGLLPAETHQLALNEAAIAMQTAAVIVHGAAIPGHLVPTIYGLADGGMKPGDAIMQGAAILEGTGNALNMGASLAATQAEFERRKEEWQLQQLLATDDLKQIEFQKKSAQINIDIAKQELKILQEEIKQKEKEEQYYLKKFTNEDLYHWYIGKLSSIYTSSYQLAINTAIEAQNALGFELIGEPDIKNNYITQGSWNYSHQGLLAGESLLFDLHRMEKTYLDKNRRKLEIIKTISLAQLNNGALTKLINDGECLFDLTEKDFAFDYPGHYCRQIKSISVSIPMVLGPYQNIHATLTQLSNKLVSTDDSKGLEAVKYLLGSKSDSKTSSSIVVNLIPNQQIALSQGVNDSGLFELNFDDSRYLPFEGTGAVSSWKLEIPKGENSIKYESITDVIIELKYTAIQGSNAYKNAVIGARGTRDKSNNN